jgi:O-antigen/teichoic acid export membrane protein/peptidoglycan/xylan/chitin deacetylase (PgdA/CDA1 family)
MEHQATVARNAVWLIAQGVFNSLVAIVVMAVTARYLGTGNYGILLLMLSYGALFAPVSTLGLRPYSVREMASQRDKVISIVEDMLALRLILAINAIVIATAYILMFEREISPALLVVLALLLVLGTLATCFVDGLYGVESFKSVATVMAISGLVVQGSCLAAVFLDAGLLGVASAYVLGVASSLIGAWMFFRKEVGPVRLIRVRQVHWQHVQRSWAFFFQSLVLVIRYRMGVMIINGLLGPHAAGVYGAAQALTQRIDLLQDGMATALFPRVSDLHVRAPEQLKQLVRGTFKVLLVISTPMAVGLYAVSPAVVDLIFGSQFVETGSVLAILALGIPFSFVYGVMFNVFTATGRQREVFVGSVSATVLSLSLMPVLIYFSGIDGAAAAYVTGLACLALHLVFAYWRRMGPIISLHDALGIAAANGIMAVVLVLLRDAPLVWKIPACALVFAAAIRLFRIVTLEMIIAIVRRRKVPFAPEDEAVPEPKLPETPGGPREALALPIGKRVRDGELIHAGSIGKRGRTAKILGPLGVLGAVRGIRTRVGRGIPILGYHRVLDVSDEESFPYDIELVSASVAGFTRQMEHLCRRYEPIALSKLLDCLDANEPPPRGSVVVTFDDGFADNYDNAFPILRRFGIPATMFLATGYIDSQRKFWYEDLCRAILTTRVERAVLPGIGPITFGSIASRREIVKQLLRWLKSVPDVERRGALQRLHEQLEVAADPSGGKALSGQMTWAQIREMSACGIEFGSHSVSHPVLSMVEPALLDQELTVSKRQIEDATGKPVHTLAYPVGDKDAFNDSVRAAARLAGYRAGISYISGMDDPRHWDRFAIRRLQIERFMDDCLFEATVALPEVFAY